MRRLFFINTYLIFPGFLRVASFIFCFILTITFTSEGVSQTLADSLEQRISRATQDGRIVDNLNNSFSKNPKGEFLLAPENRDLRYAILIYNIDIFPEKAVFSAGLAFRDPKSNQLIAFRADNIIFSNKTGLTGPAKLYLISDVTMKMGRAADITVLSGFENTFANFECKGLREFGVTGKADFNPALILPVDAQGLVIEGKKLSTSFKLIAKTWSDMVMQISIEPFQIKGLNNYIFNISNATMDLSESANNSTMLFPKDYNTSEILGGQLLAWEGFYLEKGSVTFPEHFKKSNNRRLEIGVEHLLIDEFGFSGNISGQNLLDFDQGQVGSWSFSIDRVEISILMNHLNGGSMAGGLGLPILPDTSKLNYDAYISTNDNYGIMVSTRQNLTIPAFKVAKLTLLPNSFVDMEIKAGDLSLNAQLNGFLSMESKGTLTGETTKFKFPEVAFQGLRVSNKEPKFDIDYLGLENKNSQTNQFSKYPLNINNIYLVKAGNEKRIGISFSLNLMETIAVQTGLFIVAEQQVINAKDRLVFKRLELNDIEVNSSISCFTLNGRIQFIKEDPDFGNGFNGNIKFTIKNPKIEAGATVLFGNKNQHRYWYFDASVIWDKPGIPFFPGAEINGFMGGAWHGMREATNNDAIKNPQYGITSIGKLYIPDAKSGLGLRAGIYIKSSGGNSNNNAFLAKTILEMQFNSNKGIDKLGIFGNVDVMTKNIVTSKDDLKTSTANVPNSYGWESYKANYTPAGNISGPFMLNFDFKNSIYQANFAAYIQGIAQNKIIGIGTKGLAGEISILFGANSWHFWVGTPQQPLGVRMNLGKVGDARINAYFMAGKEVKPAEPLPSEITNILGNLNADAMRQLNEMAAGNAFAFGSRLFIQIGSEGGEKNVSIYASLRAVIGFDINVTNYGKNSYCEGFSGPPGINGWFANGQLFAFLQGKVGASFKTKAISGKVDLMTLTTAAQLYCQGPNPFFSNGTVYVQVNIAGIINTKMKLNFAVGEPCDLQKTSYTDTNIILETNPINNESNVSTLSPIKVNFSVPLDKSFRDTEGKEVIFKLSRFEITENGKNISGRITWNPEQNGIRFDPANLLPGNKKLKLLIYVEANALRSAYLLTNSAGNSISVPSAEKTTFDAAVQKMKDQNLLVFDFGKGRKIKRIDTYEPILLKGKKVDELREVYFTTTSNPNSIPNNNIAFCYPVQNQLNCYKDQSSKGYLQLVTGQDYLFNLPNAKLLALFIDLKGYIIGESKINVLGKKLEYTFPTTLLKNNSIYQIFIKRYDIRSPSEIGKNVNTSTTGTGAGLPLPPPSGKGVPMPPKSGTSTKIYPLDLLLYSYSFGTSAFPLFENKIAGFSVNSFSKTSGIYGGETLNFKASNSSGELFDAFETSGKIHSSSSVKPEISLDMNLWYSTVAQKVYSIFQCKDPKILSDIFINRDASELGLIPVKAIRLIQTDVEKMQLIAGKLGQNITKPAFLLKEISIESNFSDIVFSDLNNIKTSLTKYIQSNSSINTIELNKFITAINSTTSSSSEGALLPGGSDPAVQSGPEAISPNLSVSSLNLPSVMVYDNNSANLSLPPDPKSQNNIWILKIARLKINQVFPETIVPISFNYYLPGENTKSSVYLFNKAKTGK